MRGLELEIGALRVSLTRVLMEEEDASTQARELSRLAKTTALLLEEKAKLGG